MAVKRICFAGVIYMTLEDYCGQNGIRIIYFPLSSKIKGMTVKDMDGFIIVLNSRYDNQILKKTLKHELLHIIKDHFQMDPDKISECEMSINNIIENTQIIF